MTRRRRAPFVLRALRRRWWLAAAIFSFSCGAVGMLVLGGSGAARYRSTAFVRVAGSTAQQAAPATDAPLIAPADVLRVALAPATRQTALLESHLPGDDLQVGFAAQFDAIEGIVALTATAPTPDQATDVARAWAGALGVARGDDAAAPAFETRVSRRGGSR